MSTSVGTFKMEGDIVACNYDNGNSDNLTYDEESNSGQVKSLLLWELEKKAIVTLGVSCKKNYVAVGV